jgi:hypothetical protein
MRLQELFENRLEQAKYNADFDKANGPWEPTRPKRTPTHYILINGTKWKTEFYSYESALTAANTIHSKRPWVRIDIREY